MKLMSSVRPVVVLAPTPGDTLKLRRGESRRSRHRQHCRGLLDAIKGEHPRRQDLDPTVGVERARSQRHIGDGQGRGITRTRRAFAPHDLERCFARHQREPSCVRVVPRGTSTAPRTAPRGTLPSSRCWESRPARLDRRSGPVPSDAHRPGMRPTPSTPRSVPDPCLSLSLLLRHRRRKRCRRWQPAPLRTCSSLSMTPLTFARPAQFQPEPSWPVRQHAAPSVLTLECASSDDSACNRRPCPLEDGRASRGGVARS